MPVTFPNVTPAEMTFTPPEYPVGEDTSLGGVSITRRYGNRPVDARLSMEFSNIPNSIIAQIIAAHNNCKSVDSLILPDLLFQGAEEDLKQFLNASAYQGLTWHFVQGSPPRVSRAQGGAQVGNVSVELRAKLTYS
jgi:hypothetical protein